MSRISLHEQMHRWGAFIEYLDPTTQTPSISLLSADNDHWSFYLESNGSVFYGNHWQDNGDGTFTSIEPDHSVDGGSFGKLYSPLGLYLMGMYDKSQVPPMLLIKEPVIISDTNPEISPKVYPQTGVTVQGAAIYVTIDQIVAAAV